MSFKSGLNHPFPEDIILQLSSCTHFLGSTNIFPSTLMPILFFDNIFSRILMEERKKALTPF